MQPSTGTDRAKARRVDHAQGETFPAIHVAVHVTDQCASCQTHAPSHPMLMHLPVRHLQTCSGALCVDKAHYQITLLQEWSRMLANVCMSANPRIRPPHPRKSTMGLNMHQRRTYPAWRVPISDTRPTRVNADPRVGPPHQPPRSSQLPWYRCSSTCWRPWCGTPPLSPWWCQRLRTGPASCTARRHVGIAQRAGTAGGVW